MSTIPTINIDAIRTSISLPRISTYDNSVSMDLSQSLSLYAWNAGVSGSFLYPLHLCEIVIRNSVSEALTAQYGDLWVWNESFVNSLTSKLKNDLLSARGNKPPSTIGKIIPELNFNFWQKMFTSRHDSRIWINHLETVLPNINTDLSIQENRKLIYQNLDKVRLFRNRIAHHEPIFNRQLLEDYNSILELIRLRCNDTADWLESNQITKEWIDKKP